MKSSFTLNEINFFASGDEDRTSNLFGWIDKQIEEVNICSYLNIEDNFNSSEIPCERILSNIFNYSKALSVVKTDKAGSFNFLMN